MTTKEVLLEVHIYSVVEISCMQSLFLDLRVTCEDVLDVGE